VDCFETQTNIIDVYAEQHVVLLIRSRGVDLRGSHLPHVFLETRFLFERILHSTLYSAPLFFFSESSILSLKFFTLNLFFLVASLVLFTAPLISQVSLVVPSAVMHEERTSKTRAENLKKIRMVLHYVFLTFLTLKECANFLKSELFTCHDVSAANYAKQYFLLTIYVLPGN